MARGIGLGRGGGEFGLAPNRQFSPLTCSTGRNIISWHEARPDCVDFTSGALVTNYRGSDPNHDTFSAPAGFEPTLVLDTNYTSAAVYYLLFSGAQYLLNAATWPKRVCQGAAKSYSYHAIVRVDDLPNTLGSALMGVCSNVAAQRYIQQVITHPTTGHDRITVSRRGDTGINTSAVFQGPSRNQILDIWIVFDASTSLVSVYVEGTRLDTLAMTSTSTTPTHGIMGALFLAGVASTFAFTSEYSHTWYNRVLSVAEMREVGDAYTCPKFRTRGSLSTGKLIVIKNDGYQKSTAHCATWRTGPVTLNGIQYVIGYTSSDARACVLQRAVTSDVWAGSGGDPNPSENNDSAFDGHNNVSLGVSLDGVVHYGFDMHVAVMKYGFGANMVNTGVLAAGFGPFASTLASYANAAARNADTSLTAADIGKSALQTDDNPNTTWQLLATTPVWQATWGEIQFTYPHFDQDRTGDVYFFGRDGRSGQGFQVCARYNYLTGLHSHICTITDEGTGLDPYNSYFQQCYDYDRDVWHFSWVNRHGVSAGVESNEGIYYAKSANLAAAAFTNSAGTPYVLPISSATGEKIITVGFDRELINQQTMAVDPGTGYPVVVMTYAPSLGGVVDVHVIFWNGTSWTDRTLGVLTNNFSYGEPANTLGNPTGTPLPATTDAFIGRPGSVIYNGRLYIWMSASEWGQGVYELMIPIATIATAPVRKNLIISDATYVELAGSIWAGWEGQTPDIARLRAYGVLSFTFQRGNINKPASTPQAEAWPAWPYYLYERDLRASP